jgi:uncharacterized protein YbjQ (UPF0145 family)
MIITTTENIGKEYEVIGLVRGNTVQSRHVGRDIIAVLKSLIGGEIKTFTELLTHAREEAIERMVEEAKKQKADAVIGVRLVSANIIQNVTEILAYGTAVRKK